MFSKFHASSLLVLIDERRNHVILSREGKFIQDFVSNTLDPNASNGNGGLSLSEPNNQLAVVGEEILNVEPIAMREKDGMLGESVGLCTPERNGWGNNCRFLEGVANRNEDLLSEWVIKRLGEFGSFLGLSFEGFEKEAMDLFRRTESRRGLGDNLADLNSLVAKKLRSEFQKLENTINYEVRSGGSSEKCLRYGERILKCI